MENGSEAPSPVVVTRGDAPIILGFPHVGVQVPADVRACLNEEGLRLRDTDWHVDELYRDVLPGATTVRATFHRYVVDANRDPEGRSLYPGQNTTDLVPSTDFDMTPIWKEGRAPDARAVAERVAACHRPYHRALEEEIRRVRARHGVAVLFDCHSIRSRCPALFEGRLPDLNIGTDGGRTCAPVLQAAVLEECERAVRYTHVLNGRFRGGWTTRHYGRPDDGVHAIQLELAQSTYLECEQEPFAFDPEKADRLRPHLGRVLTRLCEVAATLA